MIQEENVEDVVENVPCHIKNILNESDGRLLSKEGYKNCVSIHVLICVKK